RTLKANFSAVVAEYTVTVSASPAAGGTVSGGGTFDDGTSVTVSAVPNPGYEFLNWTEGSTVVSSSESYSFTVNADRMLVANFSVTITNIYDLSTTTIKLFPNPASHSINITGISDNHRVHILRTDGTIVKTINPGQTKRMIPINDLNPGVYFIIIESESEFFPVKFIKG
ncbi:MAG: T9SS type A sorting domain-containing protein, partial [Bacteroidales bacterium]|nr:T9SS type A sorting domain-containing protein [Bacteroidales bacterium]